ALRGGTGPCAGWYLGSISCLLPDFSTLACRLLTVYSAGGVLSRGSGAGTGAFIKILRIRRFDKFIACRPLSVGREAEKGPAPLSCRRQMCYNHTDQVAYMPPAPARHGRFLRLPMEGC